MIRDENKDLPKKSILPNTHESWKAMRTSARGETSIDRSWLGQSGFKNFLKDMGPRPENMTLDRIDPDGAYCKKNCRWATWEQQGNNKRNSSARHVRRLLESLGLNLEDPNLKDTAIRVAKSLREDLLKGYSQHPSDCLSTYFPSENDQMVILTGIEFYSTCSHHLLPFHGLAHIGYVPKGRVVGLSKLARLVEIFARRLQLQEDLTDQIAKALLRYLNPKGVMVVMRAQHMCMACRGVAKQKAEMITSATTGVFRKDQKAREEFFSLINGKN